MTNPFPFPAELNPEAWHPVPDNSPIRDAGRWLAVSRSGWDIRDHDLDIEDKSFDEDYYTLEPIPAPTPPPEKLGTIIHAKVLERDGNVILHRTTDRGIPCWMTLDRLERVHSEDVLEWTMVELVVNEAS